MKAASGTVVGRPPPRFTRARLTALAVSGRRVCTLAGAHHMAAICDALLRAYAEIDRLTALVAQHTPIPVGEWEDVAPTSVRAPTPVPPPSEWDPESTRRESHPDLIARTATRTGVIVAPKGSR